MELTPAIAGLRVVRAANPSVMTLDGTHTYLIGSDRPVVIDPGPDDPGHLRALLDALRSVRPAAIALTHRHPDHAALAPALATATGAPVRAAIAAAGEPLTDGEVLASDAGAVVAVATPGHTPDHLSFVWDSPAGRIVFVGDLLMGEGDTTLVAAPEGDLGDYLASLERVRALRPDVLLPAHGAAIADPDAALDRYRRHREQRLDATLSAVRRGEGAGREECFAAVYGDGVPDELRPAAEASLSALLEYLERSGSIRRSPDGVYAPGRS